jgi:hypothetical protein
MKSRTQPTLLSVYIVYIILAAQKIKRLAHGALRVRETPEPVLTL